MSQDLELESKKLKEQVADISRRMEEMADKGRGKEDSSSAADVQKLEIRCKEMETKLELEKLRALSQDQQSVIQTNMNKSPTNQTEAYMQHELTR